MEPREFVTVESEDGRLGFLIFYGVVGTLAVVFLLPHWLAWIALPMGAFVGSLMAWRMYGAVELYLEGDVLVQRSSARTRHVNLARYVSAEYRSGFKSPPGLVLRDGDGAWVDIGNLGPETEPIRYEIGRRLRALSPGALNRVGPSEIKALGLR